MNWSEALSAAIEVGIAIVGFSGIIAAIGRRSVGDWTATDQLLLRILLTSSSAAIVFAFLPFIILDTGLDPVLFWKIGSGAQFAWILGIVLFRNNEAGKIGASLKAYSPWISFFIFLPVLVLLLVNMSILGAPWPYVIGVCLSLFTAVRTFVRLLLDSWRPGE